MIVIDVAVKTLREAVRQPKNLAITLGLPVAFMLIFGLAFGGEDEGSFSVAVLNEDDGPLGAAYVAGLENVTYASGTPVVFVRPVDDVTAGMAAVADGDRDAFIILPATFTRDITPQGGRAPNPPLDNGEAPTPPVGATLRVIGNPSTPGYAAVNQILGGFNQAFAEEVSGDAPLIGVAAESVASTELTTFDFIAPGLMIFAVLNLAPQAAATLAREAETRTLDRVRLSPTRAAGLLGGVAVAFLVLATVSVGLMLLAAELMGFNNQGSFLAAYVIALAAAFGVLGFGMVIAALARTQDEAANMGALIAVPASFLSGAFFPVPDVDLFQWGSRTVGLYDVLPTKHAVDALQAALTFGESLATQTSSLLALVVLAALYFAGGVALYRRTRFAAQ